MRKIKYKDLPKELDAKVAPRESGARPSIGMEKSIGEYYHIELSQLMPFKSQARRVFNEKELKELVESIKQYGLRQPLTIKKSEDGLRYEVISGERRFRAAKLVGLDRVPCIILKERESAEEIALVENLHREDLHPIEFGEACIKFLGMGHVGSQVELSRKLSISEGKVSECIMLAKLPNDIKSHILDVNIRSRDKLRAIIKNIGDFDEIKKKIGVLPVSRKNFSVLRVISTSSGFLFQTNGIRRLREMQKKELKERLLSVVQKLETQ